MAARDKFGNSLEIKEEIGNRAGEAATWAQLGSIDAKEGKYPAARDKFGKALATFQQIGDPAGEATWHLLASVDLDECNYPAAQGKIGKALAMQQQIGDRVGEAHSWQQLGLIAWKRGDRSQGIKLGALGFVVLQIVGHANVQAALRNLTYAAGELGYGQEQLQALLQEVMTFYQTDGGRALYREAFGEELSPA